MEKIDLFKVVTLSWLIDNGYKIAKLAGNRSISKTIVRDKKKSLKKDGMLIPAIMVNAIDAIEQGLKISTFDDEEIPEEELGNYVVLIDANHRYVAHIELKKTDKDYTGEFYAMYPLNGSENIARKLAVINMATNKWKGSDYGKGVEMINHDKDLPLIKEINALTDKGYSLDAASKYLLFKSVSAAKLAKAMDGEIDLILTNTSGIERGKRILNAALVSMSEDTLKTRTIIDWVIAKYDRASDVEKAECIDTIVSFFNSLNRQMVKPIEDAQGTKGVITKEGVIYEELEKLYQNYLDGLPE